MATARLVSLTSYLSIILYCPVSSRHELFKSQETLHIKLWISEVRNVEENWLRQTNLNANKLSHRVDSNVGKEYNDVKNCA